MVIIYPNCGGHGCVKRFRVFLSLILLEVSLRIIGFMQIYQVKLMTKKHGNALHSHAPHNSDILLPHTNQSTQQAKSISIETNQKRNLYTLRLKDLLGRA